MDRREIWCRHSWSPEESLLVIIWLVFLYYWVKYLRTGKIDRHKISWKHLWLSDDVSWWLCWSPGPKRCFQAVLLSTRSPSTLWHWEMLWLNTQKKLFERKNDELKVKTIQGRQAKASSEAASQLHQCWPGDVVQCSPFLKRQNEEWK